MALKSSNCTKARVAIMESIAAAQVVSRDRRQLPPTYDDAVTGRASHHAQRANFWPEDICAVGRPPVILHCSCPNSLTYSACRPPRFTCSQHYAGSVRGKDHPDIGAVNDVPPMCLGDVGTVRGHSPADQSAGGPQNTRRQH